MKKMLRRFLRPLLQADGILCDHAVFGVRLSKAQENTDKRDEIALFDLYLIVRADRMAVELCAVPAPQILNEDPFP